jgi:DNA-binding transcriptional regulator GbsR (MarR family)
MSKPELPEALRVLSQSRLELIESAGHAAQVLGFPKSIGEIYGLLYLAPQPLSSPQICKVLSASKGGVSQGVRQLVALGFIKKVRVLGNRKEHYEAVLEIGDVMRTGFDQMIKTRALTAERRMKSIKSALKNERSELAAADYALVNRRLQRLSQVQKRVKKLIPLMDAFLK